MFLSIVEYMLHTCANAFAMICLARLLLQKAQLNYGHPLAQFCCRCSDWLIHPLRRHIPSIKQWDTASITASWLILLIYHLISLFLLHQLPISPLGLFLILILSILSTSAALAYVLLFVCFVRLIQGNTVSHLSHILDTIITPLTHTFSSIRLGKWPLGQPILIILLWLWIICCVTPIEQQLIALLIN